MKEISENEYNSNISRYISTAEAEAGIDLAATHDRLVEIESALTKATAKHNGFLRELGLPPLPWRVPESVEQKTNRQMLRDHL
jgi:type I restriction enzyme M protein